MVREPVEETWLNLHSEEFIVISQADVEHGNLYHSDVPSLVPAIVDWTDTWNNNGHVIEAYPVPACEGFLATNFAYQADSVEAQPLGHSRAEFLSIKIRKPPANAHVGVFLRRGANRAVFVSRLESDGLFAKTPLAPGDQIMSINGRCVLECSPTRISRLLRKTVGDLSIIVRNKNGNPNLVSTTVQKPKADMKTGISFCSTRGSITISRIFSEGLFASTLVNVGHRCIEINGIRCDTTTMDATDAANIVRQASNLVTIISRPDEKYALVLSYDKHVR